jgi:hypothetical protein
MASVMNIANHCTAVILCHTVQIAGLKMKKEPKSVSTVDSPYMRRAVGVVVVRAATERNAPKRNALGFRTVVSLLE